jgi:hypothetical protein
MSSSTTGSSATPDGQTPPSIFKNSGIANDTFPTDAAASPRGSSVFRLSDRSCCCEGSETRCRPALIAQTGARGPVGVPSPNGNDANPSRLHENENILLTAQFRPSPQVTEPVLGTLPRWGSLVRIPSSAPGPLYQYRSSSGRAFESGMAYTWRSPALCS